MNASPAHHVVVPDRPGQRLLVLDPVLQRHHRRILTRQRPQPGRSGVGVEGLHAEQREVARADLSRVTGGRRPYLKVARHTAHPQPLLAKGLQAGPARDEVHAGAGPGKPPAEIVAGPARPVPAIRMFRRPLRPRSRYWHAALGR